MCTYVSLRTSNILFLINVFLTFWVSCAERQVKPCDIPEIKNGFLYAEDYYIEYFPVEVGRSFYYYCNSGFVTPTRQSGGYLRCTREGWSPKAPCHRECYWYGVETGYSLDSGRYRLEGDSVSVQCTAGYSLPNGRSTITCTESGWSPPPKCIRVKTCSKSDINIENGFLSGSKNTYPVNNQTQYRCKPGYVTAEGKTSGSIMCLESGWSIQPVCIKSCDMPFFENSRTKSNGTWYKLDDKMDYECHAGYANTDGSTTGSIVCGKDGWSDTPTCYERECSVPRLPPNLDASPKKYKYKVGDVLHFTCRQRSKRVGPDSIQCYDFGWSPNPPTCKGQVKSCGPPPQLPNGNVKKTKKEKYDHDEMVEYDCNPRFQLKGSKKIQCVDGDWTALPICVATEQLQKCKLFRILGSHLRLLDEPKVNHNTNLSYRCGGRSEYKQSTCINGRWDPMPTCMEEKKTLCPPPPNIHNSRDMTTTVNYQDGEKISILCEENYLIHEADEIVCRNGRWQSIPRCVEQVPCSLPPHIEHGRIVSSRLSEERKETSKSTLYSQGTKLTYICEDGFRLSEENQIICQMGKWSPPPQCVGLPCEPPPLIRHGILSHELDSYQHGEKVTYTCADGFEIDGPESIQCLGGKWSPQPQCRSDTTSVAGSEEDLRHLLMKTNDHSLEYGLHLNIKKTKIVTTGLVSNIVTNGERIENVKDFILLGFTINTHGSSGQETKKHIALGKSATKDLLTVLKSHVTLKTKMHLTQAMIFSITSYVCESWTMYKDDRRFDAFELLCWIRLLTVLWATKRTNRSALEDVQPECSLEAKMARLPLTYFGHVFRKDQSLEKDIMLRRVEGKQKR